MSLQMRPPESDHTLLQAFARRQCQRSFAALVERHGPMVYSAALRQVRRADLADDVTQAVFLVLAERAGQIGPAIVLAAWLHKTCRYVSLNALKMERRRAKYEQRAATMAPQRDRTSGWAGLWPLLDESIDALGDPDRNAIVLRFLEQRSLAEIGKELGVSEDAAGMRISRALERLRAIVQRRGVGLSGANLGIVLGLEMPRDLPQGVAAFASRVSESAGGSATMTFASRGVSERAAQLAGDMNRALAWQAVGSGAMAFVASAAVFALLLLAAHWWVSPPARPAATDTVLMADASPAPPPLWKQIGPMALP